MGKRRPIKIDIDDAIDRLQCMAREVQLVDKRFNPTLRESQEKDRELLINLIPIVRAIGSLGEV